VWSQQPQPAEVLAGRIGELNTRLESLASFVPDAPNVNQLLSERNAFLNDLIAADPARAVAVQLPAALAARIRAASPQAAIEQEGDWSGALDVLVEDDFVAGRSRQRYILHIVGSDLEVFFAPGAAPRSSRRLKLHGVRLGGRIAAMRISPEIAQFGAVTDEVAAAGPECSTLGVQDMAVILVTTPSNPSFPAGFTTGYFQTEFFGTSSGSLATDSLNRVMQEMSHGQTSVAGQVFGPFALMQNYTCAQNDPLLSAAIAAADPSINFTSYRRIAVVFPITTCTYGGLGTVGCGTRSTADGSVNASVSWLPISPSSNTQLVIGVFAHEFGHNLGISHADTDDYGNVPLGPLGVTGANIEYGDRFSTMGISLSFNSQPIAGQFSAIHKSIPLRWLGFGSYQEVQHSSAFTLVPFENTSGLRGLRILRDAATSSWLWLEYRQAIGDLDSSLSLLQNFGTTNIFDGALIHYEDALTNVLHTNLLDFTPVSAPNSFYDATMVPGNTWIDTDSLLKITVNSANASGLSVNVTYDAACAALSTSPTVFPAAGGSGNVTVTAPSNCAWTASAAAAWINLTGSTSGMGNGVVPFNVLANAGVRRGAYITVQRQSVALVEEGTGLSVISVSPSKGAGSSGQFTFVLKHASGYQSITGVDIAFSDIGEYAPDICQIQLSTSGTPFAFLWNDPGNAFQSGINLQTAGLNTSNSQCTLFSTGSSVVGSGNQLTITLQMSFSLGFSGSHRISVEGTPLGIFTVQPLLLTPSNGATSVPISTSLTWTAMAGATSYDVYLGATNPPTFVTNVASTNYSPTPLAAATQYYWRVVAKSATMSNPSAIWSFSTGNCLYVLSPPTQSAAASGGSESVSVTAPGGCGWAAVSNAVWITVTSGTPGSGNGNVGYTVAANGTNVPRTGTITVGGQIVKVDQAGTGGNQTPAPVSVTPGSGNSASQTFTFIFTDPTGFADLDVLNILINSALNGNQSCYLAYSRPANVLYLVNNAGNALLPGMVMNGSGSVNNSQCSVNGVGSSAVGAANTLTLTLNMSFPPAYAGNKIVYIAARDSLANNSGWQALGTWRVPGASPTSPAVGGMTPASGTGMAQTLTFTFTDTSGFADLGVVNILVNDFLNGNQACYLAYSRPSNVLYLVNDAGSALLPGLVMNGSGSLNNSQCSVNGVGSTVVGNGNTLTVTLNMAFTPSFVGNRVVYAAARDVTDLQNSGWQAVGAWKVQ